MEPLLKVEALHKSFAGRVVVENLSFSLQEGEVFGLLGPNGAGKTTALKMVVGILPPCRGKVYIKGIDVYENPLVAKKLFGYVPEATEVMDKLTAQEYVEFRVCRIYRAAPPDSQGMSGKKDKGFFQAFRLGG